MYLAHVSPRVQIPQGDSRTWEEQTSDTTRELMCALELQLNAPARVKIKHVSLHGDPASELLAFAEEFDVQLIAAGTHGRSAIGRLLMGSVSTQLVRQARSWVLVAPPAVDTDSVVG
ncbi:MAG: universal stress protein [Gemmatimonadaceae bacterium]